ncbi:unnamed protein product [Phytophthora lilii]|uniref:Unnamed protein product n=1 Tax=Phytophthora lilii TaxID=2077276 RepID=A0A9W6T9F0_9STRA|nr:unnamed protein product [Phytophthora lilii]
MLQQGRPKTSFHVGAMYSVSASYLGMFLRSFALLRAADVSVLVEPYATDPSVLQVTLTYSDALMFRSVEFFSTAGQASMLEDSPAQAMLEYPVSSTRPALDIILRELRARINSDDDFTGTIHSWILAQDCLACSAQLFECSSTAVASKSCNYNTMSSPFGQCLRKQVSTTLFEGMMEGIVSSRPVVLPPLHHCSFADHECIQRDVGRKLQPGVLCFHAVFWTDRTGTRCTRHRVGVLRYGEVDD